MSARSLNKVMLLGNLTRDPEIRYTPSGTAVCTFGLATNRTWTSTDGTEPQEETEYHRIVAWSKLAEICSQLLFKGRKVYVEGRLQTRKWTGQDGQERTTTEVVIDEMIALGAPRGRSEGYEDDSAYEERQTVSSPEATDEETNDAVPAEEQTLEQSQTGNDDHDDKQASQEQKEVNVDDIPF